jgi:hypothetical protein
LVQAQYSVWYSGRSSTFAISVFAKLAARTYRVWPGLRKGPASRLEQAAAYPITLPEPAIAVTTLRAPVTSALWIIRSPVVAQSGVAREHLSRIPLGRVGELEDLMGAVPFVASDPLP